MEEKPKKERVRFTTKIVVSAVLMTTIYTAACFWLAMYNIDHMTDVSIPVELTTLYFAFWTIELVMLTTLDKTKIKNKYHKNDDENGDDIYDQQTPE